MDLKNVPKWVYLGKEELEKYGIPPFWYLRKDWTWIVWEMKILDEAWNYEFNYKLE